MNPWCKLANEADPFGSGFSTRPCHSNKAGRVTEGDTGCQCHSWKGTNYVQARGLRADSPLPHLLCSLSCPLPWPPPSSSCLAPILSPLVSLSPRGSLPVGCSLSGIFSFRLWGGSWAMAMSLEVTGEVTVQTALRRVRKERREEGTWDRGDESEVYKRLPGNLWEPHPHSLLWGPPSYSPTSAPLARPGMRQLK